MGSQHKENYSVKHPPGTQSDPAIETALPEMVKEGRISCAAAHGLAKRLNVSPAAVGLAMDMQNFRISRCQLGLFGHTPERRIVKAAEEIQPRAEEAVRDALKNGRLACIDAWGIAKKLSLSRMEIAGICEALQIRISPCQLGAF